MRATKTSSRVSALISRPVAPNSVSSISATASESLLRTLTRRGCPGDGSAQITPGCLRSRASPSRPRRRREVDGEGASAGACPDLCRRAVGGDAPLSHQHDPVGEVLGLLEVVRREDDRPPARGFVAHRGPELPSGVDVHPGRRLIEDEQVGIGEERQCEPQTLLLAAAAGGHAPSCQGGDACPAHDRLDGACSAKVEAISRTVSSTLRSASSPPVWRTAETRPASTAARGCRPITSTVPAVGSVRPRIMSSVVVFPAPFGPSSATTSPAPIVRSMSSTAVMEPCGVRNVRLREARRMVGVLMTPAWSVACRSGWVACHDFGVTPVMGGRAAC